MKRLYCDRCGKEVKNIFVARIPDERVGNNGSYKNKDVELCKSCKSFVETATREYNNAMTNIRIAFFKALFPSESIEDWVPEDTGMDKNNLIIEKILGVDLHVLTTNGKHHKISIMDLLGSEGGSLSVDTDDNRVPRCMIDIHLEADKFSYGIDIPR